MTLTPTDECARRLALLRQGLADQGLEGAVLLQAVDVLWLAGTRQNAGLWVPVDSDPVLLVRKSLERARAESPLAHVVRFPPTRELAVRSGRTAACGITQDVVPVAVQGLWTKALPGVAWTDVSGLVRDLRSAKSPWEVERMRETARMLSGVFRSTSQGDFALRRSRTRPETSVQATPGRAFVQRPCTATGTTSWVIPRRRSGPSAPASSRVGGNRTTWASGLSARARSRLLRTRSTGSLSTGTQRAAFWRVPASQSTSTAWRRTAPSSPWSASPCRSRARRRAHSSVGVSVTCGGSVRQTKRGRPPPGPASHRPGRARATPLGLGRLGSGPSWPGRGRRTPTAAPATAPPTAKRAPTPVTPTIPKTISARTRKVG